MGWNITGCPRRQLDGFDIPYIEARTEALEEKPYFAEITHFDLMNAFDKHSETRSKSLKLDYVSQKELGLGKIERPPIHIMVEKDYEGLIRYNVRDVLLCVAINKKKSFLNIHLEMALLAGCSVEDTFMPSRTLDMFMLHFLKGETILPAKEKYSSCKRWGGCNSIYLPKNRGFMI